MEKHVRLSVALYDLAWSTVSEGHARSGTPLRDPLEQGVPVEEQRSSYLRLLRVLTAMERVLQDHLHLVETRALVAGATYGEIGRACGISRQAARQRRERRRRRYAQKRIRLAGGPNNGEWRSVTPGEPAFYSIWEPYEDPALQPPSRVARYIQSKVAADEYVFNGYERTFDDY
jgi:hypothetical protein